MHTLPMARLGGDISASSPTPCPAQSLGGITADVGHSYIEKGKAPEGLALQRACISLNLSPTTPLVLCHSVKCQERCGFPVSRHQMQQISLTQLPNAQKEVANKSLLADSCFQLPNISWFCFLPLLPHISSNACECQ